MYKELILTAASPAYEASLLALIGSLNVNWPNHPKVLVYDLGIGAETLTKLASANVDVKKVPEFCIHWRKHFTWKIWCCNDAPCDAYLWIDAGVCVLRPMPDAFYMIKKMGYFCQPNGFTCEDIVPPALMNACGLSANKLRHMLSINGGLHGILKNTVGIALLSEAMGLALNEQNMCATKLLHRHDQALLSILFYKYFVDIVFADHLIYAGHKSPIDMNGQKIWVHRRRMTEYDMKYFSEFIQGPKIGKSRIPQSPLDQIPHSFMMQLRIRIAKLRGRYSDGLGKEKVIPDGVRD